MLLWAKKFTETSQDLWPGLISEMEASKALVSLKFQLQSIQLLDISNFCILQILRTKNMQKMVGGLPYLH